MAECNECFICFESTETDVTGTLIDLCMGGCGCSHLVHEWCLVKWYTIYGKGRDECPLCKMPGEIRDIDVLIDKFRDRIPVRVFIDGDGDGDDGEHLGGIGIGARRRVWRRVYFIILMGLLCILFILRNYPSVWGDERVN